MRRSVIPTLLSAALCLSAPARAAEEEDAEEPEARPPLEARALWVGGAGGGASLLGLGLWLESVRQVVDAEAKGDVNARRRALHLGTIGGSIAFTGLCFLGAAAVMSTWRTPPVQVSFSVSPQGGWTLLLSGGTF